MARFQGNIHAGSDRAAATVLFVVLLAILLLVGWWIADPAGMMNFFDNLAGRR